MISHLCQQHNTAVKITLIDLRGTNNGAYFEQSRKQFLCQLKYKANSMKYLNLRLNSFDGNWF
jgi:hypothetical protein